MAAMDGEFKDAQGYVVPPTVVVLPPSAVADPAAPGGSQTGRRPTGTLEEISNAGTVATSVGSSGAFFSGPCCGRFLAWLFLYLIFIVLSAFITAYAYLYLGLALLSLLPAVTILTFLETTFHKSVIRMQMVITFFEAVLWMVPIVVLENVVQELLIDRTGLPKDGGCGLCILSSFLQSFIIAGLFEESVKYLAVRRIVFKEYVVDPRALVVYSCCAGAAFGTVEDVMYNLKYGLTTAVLRAFVSVPLHCGTGLLIGLSLAQRRFFQSTSERWYKTLILPVLVHGAFDFVQFVFQDSSLAMLGVAISLSVLVGTYLYVRRRLLTLFKAFPHEVDVHEKLRRGDMSAPGIACLGCHPVCCPGCYL